MRNKKSFAVISATILFCIVALVACIHMPQQPVPTVSFSADVIPIFKTSCAINGNCHLGANNANDEINLDSSAAYSTIVSKQLVNTGNPTASLLYNEISTGTMPKAPYNALSTAQINLILDWIKEGAQNN